MGNIMQYAETVYRSSNRTQQILAGVGLVAVVVAIIAGIVGGFDQFMHIYLLAFLFWLDLSLGCLGFMMISQILNAKWTYAMERFVTAGARTMPLLAVLFIPVLLGMAVNFPWVGAGSADLEFNRIYLNPLFFLLRAVGYFAAWIWLAWTISEYAYRRDQDDDIELRNKAARRSMLGLIVLFITQAGAMVDWSMSLSPEWFSSVYGWWGVTRLAVMTFAFVLIALAFYGRRSVVQRVLEERTVGDLSGLLLAMLMAWAYLSYMQYFIIWSGNIASKAAWFDPRVGGSWGSYLTVLVILHAIPFVILLIPGVKRSMSLMVPIAIWLFVMRLVEQFWVVMPTWRPDATVYLTDFILPVAFGFLWVAVFLWSLQQFPLFPVHHPNRPDVSDLNQGEAAIEQTA